MTRAAPPPATTGRALAVVGGLAVVVVAIIVAVVVVRSRPPSAPDEPFPGIPDHIAPDELAARACAYVQDDLAAQISQDAPAAAVQADLEQAETEAEAAAARDVRWVALASGVAALRVSLEEDDPQAAALAIDVVRAECET